MKSKPMETAPKDGSRILVKAVTFGWSNERFEYVATGEKWVEARWVKGLSSELSWQEWCGNERTFSTNGRLMALAWCERPE